MSVPAALIASLAVKLIKKWQDDSSINNDLIPAKEDLIRGLTHLINFKDLVIPDSESGRQTANDQLIGLAISAIGKFQRAIAPNLLEDSFLGNQTLNVIDQLIRCGEGAIGATGGSPIVDFVPSGLLRERVEIWVYIDRDSLPRVTSRLGQPRSAQENEDDIRAAALRWTLYCNIRFRIVTVDENQQTRNKAHVWVVGESLSNPKDLALADLWPRSGILSSKLMLRMNTNRSFFSSPEVGQPVFFGTALHEFGHILGLSHQYDDGHIAAQGELMHPSHQPSMIDVPRPDQLRIQKIWGKPS